MSGARRAASVRTALPATLATAVLAAAVLAAPAVPTHRSAAADPEPAVRRVLIITLPTLTWADLAGTPTPNLDRLLRDAAVADMVVRAAGRRASIGNGYLTVGAGTRAVANDQIGGQALDAGERYGEQTAAEVFAQRTGRRVGRGIVHLGIARLRADNENADFGATPGAFGDALAAAGIRRAVIANADGSAAWTSPDAFPAYQRTAMTALMTSDGTVPAGTVRPTLLMPAPGDPFGVRLSTRAVDTAFGSVWRDRSVVLVEASDLWRAWLHTPLAFPARAEAAHRRALTRTDALVGRLLRRVDFRRDAVVVVGLAVPAAKPALSVAAVRAPGLRPGLLRSATTRRSGFVHLTDVAPTVLALLGVPRPDGMEGRAMQVGRDGGTYEQRVRTLIEAAEDGARRDARVGTAITFLVIAVLLVAGAALLTERRFPRRRPIVAWAALSVLGLLVTPFVVRGLRLDRWPDPAYWAAVFGGAAVYGLAARALGRRRPVDGLLAALAGVVALHVLDVFTGARLELSTPFGYSPTVGIRMAGIGNVSFALTGAAALVLAGVIHARRPDRTGLALAVGVLAVTFVSFTPPLFGQNFGATLATAPAFGLSAWLLGGRQVRARTVVAVATLLVGVGAFVAVVDYLRPADERTHVGRFVEQVRTEGWAGLTMVLERKGEASLSTAGGSLLLTLVLTAAVFIGLLALAGSRPLRRLARQEPQATPAGVGLGVLAMLGFALNDSGIAIPAMVGAVTVASVSYLLAVGIVPPGRAGDAEARSQLGGRVPASASATASRRFGSS